MELKSFATIHKFLKSKEFKNKDLSYCDLSNLNLAGIDNWRWTDFTFFHTNFKNTNIKFFPQSLKRENDRVSLEYCDFTGCDLSYLKTNHFENVSIKGSCFLDTHLKIYLEDVASFEETIFPLEMKNKLIGSISFDQIYLLELNAHLSYSSLNMLLFLNRFYYRLRDSFLTKEKINLYSENIKKVLEVDRKNEGYLYQLFIILGGEHFSKLDIIHFSGSIVYSKNYEEIDFSSVYYEIMQEFKFYNCIFKSITMPDIPLDELSYINQIDFAIYDEEKEKYTPVPHIIIPGLNSSSWKNFTSNRLGDTCFTKQTNLYLELGRYCNAHCFFCRNQFLETCNYDLKTILKNLKELIPFLDNIVIGGGEPTLLIKDLSVLFQSLNISKRRLFISTNGSSAYHDLERIARFFNINISRHALEDSDNDQIFGVKTIKTEDIRELINEAYDTTFTLVATCFKGGLDSVESLENYIELSDYVGAHVLFQTLHEDLKNGKSSFQIDEGVFDEVMAHLKEQGYKIGEVPIYSTGDYKLVIVKSKNEGKTISFKRYITKEELEREWYRASKRTFDLSMAPNGDLYENWHQSSNLVLSLKK